MNDLASSSYAHLVFRSGAGWAFGAATVTRLSYGTISLALLLAVQAVTDSYAVAGAVLGAYGIPVLAQPLLARLVDRFGRPRVLIPLGAAYAGLLFVIAGCLAAGITAGAVYIVLAALAGLIAPPVGPVMRQVWSTVTTPADRQRAYSLDTVSEEVVFVLGPLAVGALVAVSGPNAAVILTAALALVGSVPLAALRLPTTEHLEDAASRVGQRWWGPFGSAGFRWVVVVMAVVGLGLTPLEVAVAARATEAGEPAAAGILLAVLSIASAVGGLTWGRMRHRHPAAAQLAALLAVLAVGTLVAGLVQPLAGIGVALAIAGLAVSPLFVVAYLLADDLTPPAVQVEASTWLTTVHNLGGAVGAFAAGIVIDQASAQTAFLFGGGLLALTTLATLAARKSLTVATAT